MKNKTLSGKANVSLFILFTGIIIVAGLLLLAGRNFSYTRQAPPDMIVEYKLTWGCLEKAVVNDKSGKQLFIWRYDWGQVPFYKVHKFLRILPVEQWLAPCPNKKDSFRIHTYRPGLGAKLFVEVKEQCEQSEVKRYILTNENPKLTVNLDEKEWEITFGTYW